MTYGLSATGITGIQTVAQQLADFGRFGDGYVVHASKGETVIPLAVLNENPHLKAALFTQMREMGLEPNRYIVGDKLNSINPVTGQPEFFFKKIFKTIKNVVKTIAPVVLPVALSMVPGLGPIYGAAAGTGIATLIGGGSFKRSLRNSLIAGGIGGLYAGFQGVRAADPGQGWTGFKEGVRGALGRPFMGSSALAPVETRTLDDAIPGPAATPSEAIDASKRLPFGAPAELTGYQPGQLNPYLKGAFEPQAQPLFQPAQYTPEIGDFGAYRPMSQPGVSAAQSLRTLAGQGQYLDSVPYKPALMTNAYGLPESVTGPLPFEPSVPIGGSPNELFQAAPRDLLGLEKAAATLRSPTGTPLPANVDVTSADSSTWGQRFDRTKDYLFRGGQTPEDVLKVKKDAYNQVFLDTKGNKALAEAAYNKAGPGMLARYGPSTALGLGVAGAFGAFKPGEEPEPVDYYGPSGLDLLSQNPGLFSVGAPSRTYTPATLEDIRYSAVGGPINQNNFPPRIGPIHGRGTGTSDDVPAMLSDGEYVMTAKAVRGAGNGNRKQGMRNMYNMMRQFEGQSV